MSKELTPPVFMRHMHHSKDPLPAIGHQHQPLSPVHHQPSSTASGAGSPDHPMGQSRTSADSPHKALDESPMAVVGSLAVARRRARNNPSPGLGSSPEPTDAVGGTSPTQRSPSPPETAMSREFVDETAEVASGRIKASHRTANALLDVLDPDTDGSTIVDVLPPRAAPFQQQQQHPPAESNAAPFHRGFQ